MDVVLLGAAAQGHRRQGARSSPTARGAKVVDMSGDFRLKDAARVRALVRARAPVPGAARATSSTACPS